MMTTMTSLVVCAVLSAAPEDGWTVAPVPSAAEHKATGVAGGGGVVWYRRYVIVPDHPPAIVARLLRESENGVVQRFP